jgi:hypothetical protein
VNPPLSPERVISSRLSPRSRQVLVLLALGVMVVLGIAMRLRPDPRGFGTHGQLGLGPCAFLELSGRPCPSCGMTTAFSWAVRGRMIEGWRANPAGVVIASTCMVMVPWMVFASISGRTWPFRSAEGPLVSVVLAAVALALITWAFRLPRFFP